jgi:hypothetical protein
VEVGPVKAIYNQVSMFLRGSLFFYAFQLEAKCDAFHETMTFGKAEYVQTGRGFVITHQPFTQLYSSYFSSHILPGLEMCFCLMLYYYMSGYDVDTTRNFGLEVLPLLVLGISWVWAPFFFNPGAFDAQLAHDDFWEFVSWNLEQSATASTSWENWFASSLNKYENASCGKIFCCVFFWMLRKWMILLALLHLAYESSRKTHVPLSGSLAVFGICLFVVFCIGLVSYTVTDRRLKTAEEMVHDWDEEKSQSDEEAQSLLALSDHRAKPDIRLPRVVKYAVGFIVTMLLGVALLTNAATVGEVWWMMLTVVVFLYLVINDFIFVMLHHANKSFVRKYFTSDQGEKDVTESNSVSEQKILPFNAFKEIVIFKTFIRLVHLACGVVVLAPLYLFSKLHLNDAHNSILFNERFSRNLKSNKTLVQVRQGLGSV